MPEGVDGEYVGIEIDGLLTKREALRVFAQKDHVPEVYREVLEGGSSSATPQTHKVWGIGDSLTEHYVNVDPGFAAGAKQSGLNIGARSYIPWAVLKSQAKWMFAGIFATAGFTPTQILATHVPNAIATASEGDTAIVWCGANDDSGADDVVNIIAIHDTLREAKINTIAVSAPPHPGNPGAMALLNVRLQDYCRKNKIPYVDVHRLWANPATGVLKAAYDIGDTLHPNEAGARVAGEVIGQVVTDQFTGTQAGALADANIVFTGAGGITKPLATGAVAGTDYTTGGTVGSGTVSVVADADFLGGDCFRVLRGDSDFYFKPAPGMVTFAPGDKVRIGFAIKAPVVPPGGAFAAWLWNGSLDASAWGFGYPTIAGNLITQQITDVRKFYVDITIPNNANSTAFGPWFYVAGAGTEIRIGEVTFWNLTAIGL